MKTCRVCGVEHPDEMFRLQPSWTTRRKECLKCEAARQKKLRETRDADPKLRKRRLAQQADWRKRNAQWVRQYQREYHRAYRKRKRFQIRRAGPEYQDW